MRSSILLLLAACLALAACGEKTADEVRAEKSAKAQFNKNQK
ncbi:hypothetical protein BH11PSE11_BH11PSE11_18130 [soil metagenome]